MTLEDPAGVPVSDCVEDPDALTEPVAVLSPVPLPQRVAEPDTLLVAIPVELPEGLRLPVPL